MMRAMIVVAAALLGSGTAGASLSALVSAWGHDFTVTPFAPMELMVATATDKASGQQFNLVKMPGGMVMALVPMGALKDMPSVEAKDVMAPAAPR